ncbi:MAG: hypothetical protein K2Y21_03310 [Phycisphaerales bacterium]|nr:hypothetical protein [Phycisphaerales bacterium]
MNRWLITSWIVAGLGIAALAVGPSRSWKKENAVRTAIDRAAELEVIAAGLQMKAAEANRLAANARRAALSSTDPEAPKKASEAVERETNAYVAAQNAWAQVASILEQARQDRGGGAAWEEPMASKLRLRHNAARIGAGRYGDAVSDLETMLTEKHSGVSTDDVREQLTRAYFHAAIVSRKSGATETEWRLLADRARQHARVLAENESPSNQSRAEATGGPANTGPAQKNLEVILDFERRSLEDLMVTPQPKDSTSNCNGKCQLDSWPWERRSKPVKPKDGRGDGMLPESGS